MYDLIIIGGGPAGIAAGIYAGRQRVNALLLTKNFGGQMTKKAVLIENYPGIEQISGQDLIIKFEKHLKKQKIALEIAEVVAVEKTENKFLVKSKNGKQFEARTVVVASGADPRPLEVEGEKEFIGHGLSYCAVCDGPLFPGKTVAVIGGGNSGFESALFLNKIAKKIYILEYGPEIKADKENQELAKKTGKIEIIVNAQIKKIKGDKFVNSLIYQDGESKKEKTLFVEGVFVEIGLQPATSFVKNLVDFNEKDEIIVDPKTSQTRTPGLFAAGDVDQVPYKQIVIAAGEGVRAFLSALEYLNKGQV